MTRWIWLLAALLPAAAFAEPVDNPTLQQFYDRVRPSLVVVKYQWQGELDQQEVVGCGVVVREDGLVMVPMLLVSNVIPDAQMKDFKIVIPSDTEDETEITATFLGRDERSDVGFVKATGDHKWTALHFQDEALAVGQAVYGVGLLPKVAGYKAYLATAIVAAHLRGEIPQVVVSGGLANVGSAVFDSAFRPIGVVQPQQGQDILLDSPSDREAFRELNSVVTPPHFFVPARFFLPSLADPPTLDHPIHIPWMGVPQMQGVNEQVAEFLGIKNQPAVQIGDVIPGTPAAKAGLEPGNIVTKINGQPIERGDLPEELPLILRRHLIRMKAGDQVTLTVITDKDAPPKQVKITLEPRPREPNLAERYYAKDLGFVAREAVFTDSYAHKMKPQSDGVVVDVMRRDGAAATAKLAPEDWIMQLNGQAVTSLNEFKRDYEAFRKDHSHDEVVLVVHRRGGQEQTINIEPPQTDSGAGAEQ
jgi:S1-C subfamily serine protease